MQNKRFDQLISARWIITVEQDGVVLENHAVAIADGRIAAILSPEQIAGADAAERIELGNHVLMPGLVNLHGHSAMTLLRGMADDKALMDWLQNHIWPAEGKHVSDEFVYDGALLAMGEMFRSGTTTINDMYFFHDAMARAGLQAGMRTFVGCSILEFPTAYGQNADDYIAKGLADAANYQGNELITFTLAPHAPYTVSDDTFRKVVALADEHDMLIHCHIHETQDEVNGGVAEHGVRPLARLDKLGMLSPRLIAAHMVHLTDEEIALCAERGVAIAHNPTSNMKLASGIAPVQKLLDAGVTVGIGTDGAASNNKLDMLSETRMGGAAGQSGHAEPGSGAGRHRHPHGHPAGCRRAAYRRQGGQRQRGQAGRPDRRGPGADRNQPQLRPDFAHRVRCRPRAGKPRVGERPQRAARTPAHHAGRSRSESPCRCLARPHSGQISRKPHEQRRRTGTG